MDTLQLVLHVLNGALFGVSFYLHLRVFNTIHQSETGSLTRLIFIALTLAGLGLTGLFMFLQVDWVLNEQNDNVGDAVSWSWLIFDYLLVLYLCFNAATLRYVVRNRYGRK